MNFSCFATGLKTFSEQMGWGCIGGRVIEGPPYVALVEWGATNGNARRPRAFSCRTRRTCLPGRHLVAAFALRSADQRAKHQPIPAHAFARFERPRPGDR